MQNKLSYTKPVILAATKNGNCYSMGCASKTGQTSIACRCDR